MQFGPLITIYSWFRDLYSHAEVQQKSERKASFDTQPVFDSLTIGTFSTSLSCYSVHCTYAV